MPFDAHANLAYSTLVSAPTPALSGTALSVASGQGALFPAVPFNATVWPPSVMPITTNAEIVRVTNITGDVLTIARAQESTTAMPLAVGYQIANTITKKVITDIESAVSGGGITALTGDVTASGVGSVAATVVNLTSGVTMPGTILASAIADPATPFTNKGYIYMDSTHHILNIKNDAGVVSNTVIPSAAVSNQFLTGLAADGTLSRAQPSFTNISGTVSNGQLANSTITIAGTSTALGGSITQDTITGLASTGIIKRTAANTLAIATAGTDYLTSVNWASPGTIGSTSANTGAFTTLSASSTVSGGGFSTYLASPPAIGGTAPASGAFTTLTSSSIGAIGTTTSASANLNLPAGTTGVSSLRIAHGSAPTAPVDGDTWTTTAGIYVQINGTTVGPLGTSGGGVWGAITGTLSSQSDLQTALNAKEGTIAAGTTSQYWRGDKSWQTLDKAAVGLGSVENTALSTWAGTANITTLGTIGTGTWNATAIADGKIASALTGKTYNGLTLTSTTGTLTLALAKVLTVSNTLTLTATDGSTLAIGGGGTLGTAAYTAASAYEVPLTFSTGLTRTTNTVTVNASQSITTLSNLTGNGFVKTSGGTGALSIDTSVYLTANQSITLSGDVSGTGATAITTAIGAGKVTNAMLAGSIDLTTKVTGLLPDGNISSAATWNAKQAGSASLTSLAGLTYVSASFVKMTAAGTFALDTSTYLTSVNWAVPGTIGSTTPNTGAFTTLSAGAGAVGTPSLYFSTDTTTGFYRIGANDVGFAVSAAKVLDISSTGLAVTGAVTGTTTATFGNVKTGAGLSGLPEWSYSSNFGTLSYSILSDGNNTFVNATTGNVVGLRVNNSTIASVSSAGVAITGTLSATGTITPAQVAGIVGTTTNNNAQAGSVGEYVESVIANASQIALTSGVEANVTSISLTAGDWDVWGICYYQAAAGTLTSEYRCSVSTTSATGVSSNTGLLGLLVGTNAAPASIINSVQTPMTRISVSSTTTVYLVIQSTFTVSTQGGYGALRARRRR